MRADGENLGPAMKALQPRHRAFVLAYFETDPPSATNAARAAGYQDGPASRGADNRVGEVQRGQGAGLRVTASRLMQRQDIKAAIIEECRRRLAWDLPVRVRTIQKIAENDQHKDQLKANLALLDRGGLQNIVESTQTINITITDAEKLAKIREIYARNKDLLPEGYKKVIEADFEIIDGQPKALPAQIIVNGEEF